MNRLWTTVIAQVSAVVSVMCFAMGFNWILEGGIETIALNPWIAFPCALFLWLAPLVAADCKDIEEAFDLIVEEHNMQEKYRAKLRGKYS